MNRNYIIGLLAVALLVSGGFWVLQPNTVQIEERNIGSVAGPAIQSLWYSFGGVVKWGHKVGLNTATSTLCAIQSPAATSTLEHASIRLDSSTTTAYQLEIGYSTTKNATTTSLGFINYAANLEAVQIATTSPFAATTNQVAPSSWINFNIGGAPGGTVTSLAPTGACNVVFGQI